jgi:hypothetical protein
MLQFCSRYDGCHDSRYLECMDSDFSHIITTIIFSHVL